MLGTLFTLDSASTTMASLGAYSTPIVTDFLPIVYVVGGIALGIFVVVLIIKALSSMHHKN